MLTSLMNFEAFMKSASSLTDSFSTKMSSASAGVSINVINDEHTFVFKQHEPVRFAQGIGARLRTLPNPIFSDHEMMLVTTPQYKLISYNITDQFQLKRVVRGEQALAYFNNGFMKESESDLDYCARLERIFARIASMVQRHHVMIICLQELSRCSLDEDDALAQALKALIKKFFPSFAIVHEGYNLMLVHGDVAMEVVSFSDVEFSPHMLFAFSSYKKVMAIHLKDINRIVINVHVSWLGKEDEREDHATHGPVIADLNRMLLAIGKQFGSCAVHLVGDFNRENYNVADEQRTIDIHQFARYLALDHTQVHTSNSYTNIRYIDPHRAEGYTASFPAVLTASDYSITGMARPSQKKNS